MAIRHSITLSTSEPNNEVGNLKIRQGDEQTQTLVANITENGVPKPFVGLQPFFCAKLGQTAGLGIIEQKVTGPMNPANGTLDYVMQPEDWQQLGRQTAYFSFRKMVNDHEWTEQFSTRDFNYNVIKSAFSEGLREVNKAGSTYVWTIEDMLRLFKEYMASGKTDWEEFVEQNREILESVDPGGKLIGEVIDARRPFGSEAYPTLGGRLDEVDTQLAQRVKDTLIDWINKSNKLKTGEIIRTTGFYSLGDGGEAIYSVHELTGSEVWNDTGLGFELTSDGEIKAGNKKLKYIVQNGIINVKHFGAIGDYSESLKTGVDNTIVLQKIADFAYRTPISQYTHDSPTILFPASLGYCITTTLTIKEGISLDMSNTKIVLLNDSPNPITALVIGRKTARNIGTTHRVYVTRVGDPLINEADRGIVFYNPYWCEIHVKGVNGFGIGCRILGSNFGAVYNTVYLGILARCNILLDVAGETNGWANENLFIGGEFMNGVGSCYGVRIKNEGQDINLSDNNLFIKPSFELNAEDGKIAVPFLISDVTGTKVIAMRLEDLNDRTIYAAEFTGKTENSDIEVSAGGDQTWTVKDLSEKKTNYVKRMKNSYAYQGKEIYVTEALHKKACYYDGSQSVNVPSLHFITLNIPEVYKATTAVTIGDKGLTLPASRGIGRFVDTSVAKQFVIQGNADGLFSYYVRCYDANGQVLLPSELDVLASGGNEQLLRASGGNSYWTSPTISSLAITFADKVKYAGIYIGNGENIRGYSLSVINDRSLYASTWAGYEEIEPGVNLATTPPTVGTWGKGKRVVNDNPTVGQPKSWICTVSGTPGTWVSEGSL